MKNTQVIKARNSDPKCPVCGKPYRSIFDSKVSLYYRHQWTEVFHPAPPHFPSWFPGSIEIKDEVSCRVKKK